MLTIPNLPTQDAYVTALTLGPVPTTTSIKYVVANKAVYMKVWPKLKSGNIPPLTDELLVTPETNVITNAIGVQFRSAVAGVPAQVIAQLLEPGDPVFGSGSPFAATITAGGGIQPGVSSVQVDHNGAIVGTEPALDFVDQNGFVWAVADDAANGKVTVRGTRIIVGRVDTTGAILQGTGFAVNRTGVGVYAVTLTVAFAGLALVTALPEVAGVPGAIRNVFVDNPGPGAFTIRVIDGALVPQDCRFQFHALGAA